MKEKYMKVKRVVIPSLTALIIALQNGVAISPVEATDFVSSTDTITIEVADVKQFTDYATDQGNGALFNHWATDDIQVLLSKGGIKGIPNGDGSYRFDANAPVTTAQFIALILQASNNNQLKGGTWASDVIDRGDELGILGDFGGNYYSIMNQPITRELATFILYRTNAFLFNDRVKFPNAVDVVNSAMKDAASITESGCQFNRTGELKSYVGYALGIGVMEGDNNGNFNPQASMTRAEATAVINRLFKYKSRLNTEKLKTNYGLEVWENGMSPEQEAYNNSPEVVAGRNSRLEKVKQLTGNK